MTIKIGNITKYALFPAGQALNLPSEEKRRVRLEVNCERETRFDAVQEGEVVFLAKVEGHSTIEFVVEGPAHVLATSEGEVWLYTDEGQHIVYETDEPSFVTLDFERSPGLTEWERMQMIANLKREQREEETRLLLEEMQAKLGAQQSEVKPDVGGTQEPNDDAGGGDGAPQGGDSAEPEQAGEGQGKPAGSAKAVSSGSAGAA